MKQFECHTKKVYQKEQAMKLFSNSRNSNDLMVMMIIIIVILISTVVDGAFVGPNHGLYAHNDDRGGASHLQYKRRLQENADNKFYYDGQPGAVVDDLNFSRISNGTGESSMTLIT